MTVVAHEQLTLPAPRRRRVRSATYVRLRATIAPESVIRDHEGNRVEHDDYARLVYDVVQRARRSQLRGL